MDDGGGSITRCLGDLKAGEAEALQPVCDRYFARLARVARARICASGASRAVSDEEDVVQSVFHDLWEGLYAGRFPRLDDRTDLWRVLVHLAGCKAVDRARADARLKRGGGQATADVELEEVLGDEPTPEQVAILAEEYRARLAALETDEHRRIAELKLAGYLDSEIADELGRSLRTVTKRLEAIRSRWRLELPP